MISLRYSRGKFLISHRFIEVQSDNLKSHKVHNSILNDSVTLVSDHSALIAFRTSKRQNFNNPGNAKCIPDRVKIREM